MSNYPIIFSAPMVRALLDGRKTMTRRIPTPQWRKVMPGDRLYVRENAWICPAGWTDSPVNPMGPDRREVAYQADDKRGGTAEAAADYKLKLSPCIHMPRWASRLTLVVTATKVEPLQEITPADAIAEGIAVTATSQTIDCDTPNPVDDYRALWESLHGAGSWATNPGVVALTFTVHKVNIDQMAKGAD